MVKMRISAKTLSCK